MKKSRKLLLLLLCALLAVQAGCLQIKPIAEPEPTEPYASVQPVTPFSSATPAPTHTSSPAPTPSPTPEPTPDPEDAVRAEAAALIPNFENRYYLSRLESDELENFCAMYRCCINFESVCYFPHPPTKQELEDLYIYLNYECPELLQFDSGDYYFTWLDEQHTLIEKMNMTYIMTKDEYDVAYQKTVAALDELCAQTAGMTDYEKELFIYDYIIQTCDYDINAPNSTNAYGVFVNRVARCEGRCRAMKWAMEKLGIPCICAVARVEGEALGHSWNVIEIDGQYYDLDTTLDDVYQDGEQFPTPYGLVNVSSSWLRSQYSLYHAYQREFGLPGTDSMAGSYHAQAGCFVEQGASIVEMLNQLLTVSYNNGGGVFSLQAADADALSEVVANLKSHVQNWSDTHAVPQWRYSYYHYSDSHVLRMELVF